MIKERTKVAKTSVAVLEERLGNLIKAETERHQELTESIGKINTKIGQMMAVEIGENGNRRTYDLRDVIVQQQKEIVQNKKDLQIIKDKQDDAEKRRALVRIMEQHPKATGLVIFLMSLGLYFAGTAGLIFKIVNVFMSIK